MSRLKSYSPFPPHAQVFPPKLEKTIAYIYRGEVERGTGEPGYRWHPGYSEDSAEGKPLYPWMTIAECRADAKTRGAKARLLFNPYQSSPLPKFPKHVTATWKWKSL